MIHRIFTLAVLLSFSFQPAHAQTIDWFKLLGKSYSDHVVLNALTGFGNSSSFIQHNDGSVNLNWEKEGISILMNEKGEIKSILFMNQDYQFGDYTFDHFKGDLPFKLNLEMHPDEILSTLGAPNEDSGSIYRRIFYKTNFEYEIVFKNNRIQYFRIGLIKSS